MYWSWSHLGPGAAWNRWNHQLLKVWPHDHPPDPDRPLTPQVYLFGGLLDCETSSQSTQYQLSSCFTSSFFPAARTIFPLFLVCTLHAYLHTLAHTLALPQACLHQVVTVVVTDHVRQLITTQLMQSKFLCHPWTRVDHSKVIHVCVLLELTESESWQIQGSANSKKWSVKTNFQSDVGRNLARLGQ